MLQIEIFVVTCCKIPEAEGPERVPDCPKLRFLLGVNFLFICVHKVFDFRVCLLIKGNLKHDNMYQLPYVAFPFCLSLSLSQCIYFYAFLSPTLYVSLPFMYLWLIYVFLCISILLSVFFCFCVFNLYLFSFYFFLLLLIFLFLSLTNLHFITCLSYFSKSFSFLLSINERLSFGQKSLKRFEIFLFKKIAGWLTFGKNFLLIHSEKIHRKVFRKANNKQEESKKDKDIKI